MNDDAGLEKDADVMGAKAVKEGSKSDIIQLKGFSYKQSLKHEGNVIQKATKNKESSKNNTVLYKNGKYIVVNNNDTEIDEKINKEGWSETPPKGLLTLYSNDGQYVVCSNPSQLSSYFDNSNYWKTSPRMTISEDGIKTIANFELSADSIEDCGLGEYDKNGNLTGIYPYYVFKNKEDDPKYVSDGGITFGYGHYVSQDEYKTDKSERALVDTYAKEAPILPTKTPSNGVSYKVPNSSAMPIKEVIEIYRQDLAGSVSAVNDYLIAHNISLKTHQFDMLVSFTHNYGNNRWSIKPEKVLPKFIREGKGNYNPSEVIRIFEMHDNKDRRKEEANIFNNGYDKK